MPWKSKPKGGYTSTHTLSADGITNARQMYADLSSFGWSRAACVGAIANSCAESGLNPWRWQSDRVSYSAGYGLFQFTPASGYIDGCRNVSFYAPNQSITSITAGAYATDGACQLIVLDRDILGKWTTACWRSYWSQTDYASLYEYSRQIVSRWGSGGRMPFANYKRIGNNNDAVFAFLACYEGPRVPNYSDRQAWGSYIDGILGGSAGAPDIPFDPNNPGQPFTPPEGGDDTDSPTIGNLLYRRIVPYKRAFCAGNVSNAYNARK